MTDYMNSKDNKSRRGSVLIVVLGIVMAVTILSLAFLSRSDTELACGQNMAMRVKTDHIADSGLEHARGLILNPQEVDAEYWTGDSTQQIDTDDFYYDVSVEPNRPLVSK